MILEEVQFLDKTTVDRLLGEVVLQEGMADRTAEE